MIAAGYRMNAQGPRRSWFNPLAVITPMDKQTRAALMRFGAFVWQRSWTSIKPGKAISDPGAPPARHVASWRRLIRFALDEGQRSMVIGAVICKPRPFSLPEKLEHGGEELRPDERGRLTVFAYRPRPFMGPAFEKELPGAAALWAQ